MEYKGDFDPNESKVLARQIERTLAELAAEGGTITPSRVKSENAHKYSKYIPQTILDAYQFVHIVRYPHDFAVCCGGTHLTDVYQLGKVHVTSH